MPDRGLVLTPAGNVEARDSAFRSHQRIDIEDEFLSPEGYGELNWNKHHLPYITELASEANHPGIIRVAADAVANDFAAFMLGQSSLPTIIPAEVEQATYIVRPQDITSMNLRFGFSDVPLAPTVYARFVFSSGTSAFWRLETAQGGTSTVTTSAITVASNTWYKLDIMQVTAGSWTFYINDALVATHTTNVPTSAFSPYMMWGPTDGTLRYVDIDYFRYQSKVMGNRY